MEVPPEKEKLQLCVLFLRLCKLVSLPFHTSWIFLLEHIRVAFKLKQNKTISYVLKKKKRKDNFPFIWRNSFPRNVSVDACLVFKKRKENTLTRRSARMMSKEKRRKEMKRYMSLYIIVKRFGVNLIFGDVCVSARREKKGGRNGLPP